MLLQSNVLLAETKIKKLSEKKKEIRLDIYGMRRKVFNAAMYDFFVTSLRNKMKGKEYCNDTGTIVRQSQVMIADIDKFNEGYSPSIRKMNELYPQFMEYHQNKIEKDKKIKKWKTDLNNKFPVLSERGDDYALLMFIAQEVSPKWSFDYLDSVVQFDEFRKMFDLKVTDENPTMTSLDILNVLETLFLAKINKVIRAKSIETYDIINDIQISNHFEKESNNLDKSWYENLIKLSQKQCFQSIDDLNDYLFIGIIKTFPKELIAKLGKNKSDIRKIACSQKEKYPLVCYGYNLLLSL